MRRVLSALAIWALAATAVLASAPSAEAAETYPAASDGSFTLDGRGYGHGRGLSQWGAYGAAQSGLSTTQILNFYYPGTYITGQPNYDINVSISTAQSGQVAVDHQAGMSLVWTGGTLALPSTSPAGYPVVNWRIRQSGGSLVIDLSDTGVVSWRQYSVIPGHFALINSPGGTVRMINSDLTRTEFRGMVGAVPKGSSVQAYNAVLMESYLRSVVPSEMPSSWGQAAVSAQAVAARTYSSRDRYVNGGVIDTCDTTSCQVYRGVAKYSSSGGLITRYEATASDTAIAATANQVLITGGANSYVFAQFSSSNGGYTVAGNVPYQVAKPDPYDGVVPSSAHSWTVKITRSQLQSAYPGIGTPTALVILARDGNGEFGGRVEKLRIQGTSGSTEVTGNAFRSALGLKSTYWTVAGAPPVQSGVQASGGLVADINGDGTLDLMGRKSATGELLFYPGYGVNSFGYPAVVGGGWQGFDWIISPGDVTGDGVPDIYAREKSSGILYLYPLNRQGVATDKRPSGGGGWQTMNLLIPTGDVTGDGVRDLYARDSAGALYLFTGAPGGGFNSKKQVNSGWNGLDIVLGSGDHNGDGRPDLLARDKASGALLLYTTGAGGAITSRSTINWGWNMFDSIASAPVGATSYLYARNPSASGGALMVYGVNSAGTVSGPSSAGGGWSMFDVIF